MTPYFHSLEDKTPDYDVFVLDIWGVLHNGFQVFEQAKECLETFEAQGKKVTLLSNSPRRSHLVGQQLEGMGLTPALYQSILTSGEDTFLHLTHREDPWYQSLGKNAYHMGPVEHASLVEGDHINCVDSLSKADFLLTSGFSTIFADPSEYDETLEEAQRQGLPMVCANPDLFVYLGGRRVVCAGEIAKKYEALGGSVRYHGKPHGSVYDRIFRMYPDVDKKRFLMVGDSLHTDVAGAVQAGIDSAFIAGGMHASELGMEYGKIPEDEENWQKNLQALINKYTYSPTFAMPGLVSKRK